MIFNGLGILKHFNISQKEVTLASNMNEKVKMDISFMTYGTTSAMDKSGAYLFLPDGEARVRKLFPFHYTNETDDVFVVIAAFTD